MSLKRQPGLIVITMLVLTFPSFLHAAQIPAAIKQTQESALKGDADAQYAMGHFYLDKGSPQDYLEAEKWFRMSAKQEHVKSTYGLGWLLSRRAETMEDEIEILKLYRKAADKDNPYAQYELGLYNLNGKAGLKKNIQAAVIRFKQAAAQNHIMSHVTLIAMTQKKECDLETGEKSLEKIEAWAKKGIPQALYNLGKINEFGVIVEQNHKKAMTLYKKAASKGRGDAYIRMGHLYESGLGVLKDYKKAMRSYKAAEERGEFTANLHIGQLYEKGLGVEQNDKTAVNFYKKAALFGHLESMSRYGIMRAEGRGIEKNDAVAARWLMQAAVWGDADAQYYLGKMYQKGRIDVELEKEDQYKRLVKLVRGRYHDAEGHASSRVAKQLFEKAAAQGHEKAIAELKRDSTISGWFMLVFGICCLPVALGIFIWPEVVPKRRKDSLTLPHHPLIIRFLSAPLLFLMSIVMVVEGIRSLGWIG